MNARFLHLMQKLLAHAGLPVQWIIRALLIRSSLCRFLHSYINRYNNMHNNHMYCILIGGVTYFFWSLKNCEENKAEFEYNCHLIIFCINIVIKYFTALAQYIQLFPLASPPRSFHSKVINRYMSQVFYTISYVALLSICYY